MKTVFQSNLVSFTAFLRGFRVKSSVSVVLPHNSINDIINDQLSSYSEGLFCHAEFCVMSVNTAVHICGACKCVYMSRTEAGLESDTPDTPSLCWQVSLSPAAGGGGALLGQRGRLPKGDGQLGMVVLAVKQLAILKTRMSPLVSRLSAPAPTCCLLCSFWPPIFPPREHGSSSLRPVART